MFACSLCLFTKDGIPKVPSITATKMSERNSACTSKVIDIMSIEVHQKQRLLKASQCNQFIFGIWSMTDSCCIYSLFGTLCEDSLFLAAFSKLKRVVLEACRISVERIRASRSQFLEQRDNTFRD